MFRSRVTQFVAVILTLVGALCTAPAFAEITPDVISIQKQWAEINYKVDHDDQEDRYQALLSECEQLTEPKQASVESVIWCGIVKSTYAGYTGGLGALKYAKMARRDFERAIELDGEALNGSAYTSLGTLYSKVPGWPLGFGDDKKAKKMLQAGIELNPEGIDSNYFYADFLFEQGEKESALEYLERAQRAAPRPGREAADAGRHAEIDALRQQIQS